MMRFESSFRCFLVKNKEGLSYEEYLAKTKNLLCIKYYPLNSDVERLCESLYKIDDEIYKKYLKVFASPTYTMVAKNVDSIIDIIEYDNEDNTKDNSEKLTQYFDIFKKTLSIINSELSMEYTIFMNSNIDSDSFERFKTFIDDTVDNRNNVLDSIYDKYDDYISMLDLSPFLMQIADRNRSDIKVKVLELCYREISRCKLALDSKTKETEIYYIKKKMAKEEKKRNAK